MSGHVVCGRCGTSYAPEVFTRLQRLIYERHDGVIYERRRCLCSHDRSAELSLARPDMGDDVVLVKFPGFDASPLGGQPMRFVRVMADHYVTEEGTMFRRFPAAGPAKEVGRMGGYFRREVRGDELVRLRAWAKGQASRR